MLQDVSIFLEALPGPFVAEEAPQGVDPDGIDGLRKFYD
jgi:hypothetical protein